MVVDPTPTWAEPGSRLPDALRGVELPLELVRDVVDVEELHYGALDRFARDGRMHEILDVLRAQGPS